LRAWAPRGACLARIAKPWRLQSACAHAAALGQRRALGFGSPPKARRSKHPVLAASWGCPRIHGARTEGALPARNETDGALEPWHQPAWFSQGRRSRAETTGLWAPLPWRLSRTEPRGGRSRSEQLSLKVNGTEQSFAWSLGPRSPKRCETSLLTGAKLSVPAGLRVLGCSSRKGEPASKSRSSGTPASRLPRWAQEAAAKALPLIRVEYESLPFVVDLDAAMAPDAPARVLRPHRELARCGRRWRAFGLAVQGQLPRAEHGQPRGGVAKGHGGGRDHRPGRLQYPGEERTRHSRRTASGRAGSQMGSPATPPPREPPPFATSLRRSSTYPRVCPSGGGRTAGSVTPPTRVTSWRVKQQLRTGGTGVDPSPRTWRSRRPGIREGGAVARDGAIATLRTEQNCRPGYQGPSPSFQEG